MLATAFAADPDTVDSHMLPMPDLHHPSTVTPRSAGHCPIATGSLSQTLTAGVLRSFEAKEHIFREGDAASHVYRVEIGHVCIYRMISDGRRQVIDFAYAGDLIGLGALGEHAANAQATTRTRVRCLSMSSLRQVVREDARLGLELYEALSRELLASRELLFTVSQKTATERMASFLAGLSRRNERNDEDPFEFVLPVTRNDIADFLGLTIETVSRTFTKFRTEGLIDLTQSVLVTILDLEALTALAEGQCHRTRLRSGLPESNQPDAFSAVVPRRYLPCG